MNCLVYEYDDQQKLNMGCARLLTDCLSVRLWFCRLLKSRNPAAMLWWINNESGIMRLPRRTSSSSVISLQLHYLPYAVYCSRFLPVPSCLSGQFRRRSSTTLFRMIVLLLLPIEFALGACVPDRGAMWRRYWGISSLLSSGDRGGDGG